MNIFTTDQCPVKSAQALPNILVNKMLCESLQLLTTAHFVVDGVQKIYKPTHQNHACALFTRKSDGNYKWLYEHYKALSEEYTFRTGKHHKCSDYLEEMVNPPKNIAKGVVDLDFMCMPDECKKTLDVHKNYRYYLSCKFKDWANRTDKRPIVATWTGRNKPNWIEEN